VRICTSYIAIQTLYETTHGSYRCAPSSDVEKERSGRSDVPAGDEQAFVDAADDILADQIG
jgi:hypothetical protein